MTAGREPRDNEKPSKPASLYARWAQREHSLNTRAIALLPAGVLFLILLPLLIVRVGPAVDRLLGLPGLQFGALGYLFAGLLLVVGLGLGLWSNYVQLTRGRGTPLPMLPTQELLIGGPFRYCRNPMTLGTILAYLGLAILAETLAGMGFVFCFAALLIFYLKHFEEKELAERFGAAYVQYKQDVPFIIPRPPSKARKQS